MIGDHHCWELNRRPAAFYDRRAGWLMCLLSAAVVTSTLYWLAVWSLQ